MKLVATVDIMNRVAQSTGYGVSSSRVRQPCKAVLQIRNRADGRRFLVISTRKELSGDEYDITSIQKLRTQFVHQGLATLEIRQPPLNVMLRNCDSDQLQEFLDTIRKFGNELVAGTGNMPASAPSCSRLSAPLQDEKKAEAAESSLRKTGGAFKRPRSPELSKTETAKLKKVLTTNLKVVSVKKRENYPKEFPSSLEQVKIVEVGLRKIDTRLFRLKHLTVLDLSGNKLKSIDALANLPSQLQTLVLSRNEIEDLSWNFFSNVAFQRLQRLDLSRNRLAALPESILDLESLINADFSRNYLLCLPYNWISMKNLQTMDVSGNEISFLPATLACLNLTKLDLSQNPELQLPLISNQFGTDFVGYSTIPTLFEKATEAIMTLSRKRKLPLHILPKTTQKFLRGSKYCVGCGRMSWRYKLSKFSVRASDLGVDVIQSHGRQTCIVKQILCFDCESAINTNAIVIPSRCLFVSDMPADPCKCIFDCE
ncbi:Leucine-rich repeat protein 1 [Orchesella cincta]|uniref:Leucine-rich repeat protein 1 n=1 Tax=Orchesella cincta TaxID=48709 RepID=A0A1D2MW30_ORCCI|nr:Leucine-rich repeat protein 1 [Orchesella cincta]